jgi:predicted AlkP superfamily phosphohydrolase/phosphomutase
MNGVGIKQAHETHGARIIDLAPTILYLLGIPVPYDMDGSVINDIFDTNSLSQPSTYKEKMSKNKTIGA